MDTLVQKLVIDLKATVDVWVEKIRVPLKNKLNSLVIFICAPIGREEKTFCSRLKCT